MGEEVAEVGSEGVEGVGQVIEGDLGDGEEAVGLGLQGEVEVDEVSFVAQVSRTASCE